MLKRLKGGKVEKVERLDSASGTAKPQNVKVDSCIPHANLHRDGAGFGDSAALDQYLGHAVE